MNRPQYHFLPPSGWMNDPNGLIFWNGQYHLFYQYNPDAARWHNIHWGHAVSEDLVRWQHLPVALRPESGFADESGCWSGCAVADGEELKLIYTASCRYDPELDSADIQIHTARSQDGVHFSKDPQALLHWPWGSNLGEHPLVGFRDPVVWFQDGNWYMTLGAGFAGRGPAVLLYQSTDLKRWDYLGPLLEGREVQSLVPLGTMWECPQLINLAEDRRDITHALMVCPWENRRGFQPTYLTGSYQDGRFHPAKVGLLDAGDLYAPQAMQDPQGRWLLWGWIREARDWHEQTEADWAGVMSLPRVLQIGEDGGLEQTPAPELTALRQEALQPTGSLQAGASLTLAQGLAYEIQLSVPADTGFTLLLRATPDRAESTRLVYHPQTGELLLDRSSSSLNPEVHKNPHSLLLKPGTAPEVRVFLDGSVLEVFAQGQALASRIYPTRPDSTGITLSAQPSLPLEGVKLWKLGVPAQ